MALSFRFLWEFLGIATAQLICKGTLWSRGSATLVQVLFLLKSVFGVFLAINPCGFHFKIYVPEKDGRYHRSSKTEGSHKIRASWWNLTQKKCMLIRIDGIMYSNISTYIWFHQSTGFFMWLEINLNELKAFNFFQSWEF